jgi:signal recognition particle GTPase
VLEEELLLDSLDEGGLVVVAAAADTFRAALAGED